MRISDWSSDVCSSDLLASASLDLKRYRVLATTQAISAQTLDQQEAMVAQLRATVQSQQATVTANQVQLSHTRILSPTDGRIGKIGRASCRERGCTYV